jgi:hypothetical protein
MDVLKMKRKGIRITIGILTAFIALTAIGGGIAMLTGVDRFPLAWLEGTPFSNYTIPALLLAVVVGGSSLIAAVAIFMGRDIGVFASMAAGLIMVGYIGVEVMILNQVPPGPTWIEILYFGLGLLIFGLAAYLWIDNYRRQQDTAGRT